MTLMFLPVENPWSVSSSLAVLMVPSVLSSTAYDAEKEPGMDADPEPRSYMLVKLKSALCLHTLQKSQSTHAGINRRRYGGGAFCNEMHPFPSSEESHS